MRRQCIVFMDSSVKYIACREERVRAVYRLCSSRDPYRRSPERVYQHFTRSNIGDPNCDQGSSQIRGKNMARNDVGPASSITMGVTSSQDL